MAPPGTRRKKLWVTIALWLLLAAGLAAAFWLNFYEMWLRWFPAWRRTNLGLYDRIVQGESYYTHGPLVPLVAVLIGVLLVRYTRIRVFPQRILGGALLVLCLLFHLTSRLARVNFASGFAFVGVLAGLVLLIWGGRALRRLWFPVVLLVFMVPLPEVTISDLNFRLKMLAADWGVALANGVGIIAERTGNRVYLMGDKSFVIANVCNGLRTLISLLAFGALYAYVCRLRGLWRIGLFAMTIPVAVASNSLRIVALILVADVWDVETAAGWFHDVSGVLIFVVAFLLMFGIERLVLWVRREVGRPAKVVPLFGDVRRSSSDTQQGAVLFQAMHSRRGWVALVLIVASAACAWWLSRTIPPMWNHRMAQSALPVRWNVEGKQLYGYDLKLDQRTLTILETNDYLYRRYVGAGTPHVDFCIIFSKDNRKGTHPPDRCLEGSGEGIIAKAGVSLPPVPGRGCVPCREIIVQVPTRDGILNQYFLYTYKCGREYTSSFWEQQFIIFLNGLTDRNASGALIRVSTDIHTSVAEARQRSMRLLHASIPHLDRALK